MSHICLSRVVSYKVPTRGGWTKKEAGDWVLPILCDVSLFVILSPLLSSEVSILKIQFINHLSWYEHRNPDSAWFDLQFRPSSVRKKKKDPLIPLRETEPGNKKAEGSSLSIPTKLSEKKGGEQNRNTGTKKLCPNQRVLWSTLKNVSGVGS